MERRESGLEFSGFGLSFGSDVIFAAKDMEVVTAGILYETYVELWPSHKVLYNLSSKNEKDIAQLQTNEYMAVLLN